MVHEMKTWPQYFRPMWYGKKTFELRKDDRDFAVGDILYLLEWSPKSGEFTGRSIRARVDFILRNAESLGLQLGYCVLSLSDMTNRSEGKPCPGR